VVDAHVSLLGLGGLGSPCALGLVDAGIGRMTLLDCDSVELANLNGQFVYGHADVGRPKTEAASDALRAINPALDVTIISERLESEDAVVRIVRDSDFVVSVVDRPRRTIRLVVNAALRQAGVPGTFAYYNLPWIRVGPLVLPGRPGCEECFELVMQAQNPLYRAPDASPVLTDPTPYTASVSCIAAGLVVRQVVDALLGAPAPASLFFLNVETLETKTLAAGPLCDACKDLDPDDQEGR
jgi:ThiF family